MVVNGGDFLEPEPMYSIVASRFPVRYILVPFWVNRCVFPLLGLLRVLLILLTFCLSIRPFLCIFNPKSFFFLSGYWYDFVSSPPSCSSNFLSLFWKVLICLYCFTFCRYLFSLSSFVSAFWCISLRCTVIFCVAFSFLFQHIPVSFLFLSFGLFS